MEIHCADHMNLVQLHTSVSVASLAASIVQSADRISSDYMGSSMLLAYKTRSQ